MSQKSIRQGKDLVLSFDEEQEKIDSDPFNLAPYAETTDHWYLVPKGYTWKGYSYINVSTSHDRVTGESKTYTDIFNAVFIYSGQKIKWVIKNFDTGEEISVDKAKKKVWKDDTYIDYFYKGKSIDAALGLKKDGKTLTLKKIGNADYLASTLSVYYNGMIYETMVVMLPTKADADWCIAHGNKLADQDFGQILDLYQYCLYKGLPTKPWEYLHDPEYDTDWSKVAPTPVENDDCELADDCEVHDYTNKDSDEPVVGGSGGVSISF